MKILTFVQEDTTQKKSTYPRKGKTPKSSSDQFRSFLNSVVLHSVPSARLLDTLDTAATVWTDVKSQAPTTQQNLIPLTKLWSEKTEEEIEAYQTTVKGQVRAFSDCLKIEYTGRCMAV